MSSDAVIFIPGIKGTKLLETNRTPFDTIWSGLQSNFETIEDLELTLGKAGDYYDERVKSLIRPGEIEELAYAEFLKDLKTNKPVFIFNYDWRFSSDDSGEQLAEFIDYLIAKSHAASGSEKFKKFDFITHSLGNFVFRNYLHKHGTSKIEKVVFTVPPFLGSLDIVSTVLVGEGFFPGVKAKIRKLIRTMPGALELLPTYPGASRFSPSAAHSFFNFSHWQSNVIDPKKPLTAKMKRALADAKKLATQKLVDLATLPSALRSKILVIARDGYETMQSLTVHKMGSDGTANFVDFSNACRNKAGDGRVAHASSCHYHDSVTTLMLTDAFLYKDYSHGFVLKDERTQKLVNRFLFGRRPFNYSIPGGSIKRVVDLQLDTDSESGLKYWKAIFG
jgi:hypothetical protein